MPSRSPAKKARNDSSVKKSPWDPVKRVPLEFDKLDLNTSYEEEIKSLVEKKRIADEKKYKEEDSVIGAPRKRRNAFMDAPIRDITEVPEDWYPDEPDLANDDIDAQIDRCFERLEECIMPQFFEQRLQGLILRKEEMMKKKSTEDTSLPPLEAARVANLEALWELIWQQGDPDDQLVNIEAVLYHYRSGQLRWTGLATYWSHGKQLCEPRQFDWDEFEVINKKYKGSKSFWTEGNDGPGPQQLNYRLIIQPSRYHQYLHTYHVAFRLPGFQWYNQLEVLYDTGATMARIYMQDVVDLQGPFDTTDHDIPVIGSVRSQELTTFTGDRVIMMEVCILNDLDPRIRETPWVRIQCAVSPGACPPDEPKRLDGPWLRNVMHHAIEPTGYNDILVANTRRELHMKRFGLPRTRTRKLPALPLAGGEAAPYRLQVPVAEHLEEAPKGNESDGGPTRAGKDMPKGSRAGIQDDTVV